ncbi:MAG: hypothetical protein WB341_03445 [Terracidiphilus sp.]
MVTKQSVQHPKVHADYIGEYQGLTIYGNLQKAKQSGKDRLWIQIRQDQTKPWRVAASLSYARAVDIQFEKDLPSPC